MDLGPKNPNNEFVKSGLVNWALGNQTNLQMELDVERMKKKMVCVGINRPRQDPRRSVLIYCFLVQLQILFLFVPVFLFPFYTLIYSHSYFTRAYWRVSVDTCPINTFHKSLCSSCKTKNHYSGITFTLMRLESQLQSI